MITFGLILISHSRSKTKTTNNPKPNSSEIPYLPPALETAFKERMIGIMDQAQHTSADSGGESAAYEFGQGLDRWERECEFYVFHH